MHISGFQSEVEIRFFLKESKYAFNRQATGRRDELQFQEPLEINIISIYLNIIG
jgi:hypothetical protein